MIKISLILLISVITTFGQTASPIIIDDTGMFGELRSTDVLKVSAPSSFTALLSASAGVSITGNLSVSGAISSGNSPNYLGTAELGKWPANSPYAYFGHSDLDHSVATNYALLQQNTGSTYLNTVSGENIYFRIGNATKAILHNSGNVGINDDTPDGKLDVTSTTQDAAAIDVSVATAYTGGAHTTYGVKSLITSEDEEQGEAIYAIHGSATGNVFSSTVTGVYGKANCGNFCIYGYGGYFDANSGSWDGGTTGVFAAGQNFGVEATGSYGVYATGISIGVHGNGLNGVYGVGTTGNGVFAQNTSSTSATLLVNPLGKDRGLYVTRNVGSVLQPVVEILEDSTAATATTVRIQNDGTGDILNIFDGATEIFTILDGGNTGINKTNPTQKLEISGNVSATNYYAQNGSAALPAYALSNDTDSGMYREGSNILGFSAGGVKYLELSTSPMFHYGSAGSWRIIDPGNGSALFYIDGSGPSENLSFRFGDLGAGFDSFQFKAEQDTQEFIVDVNGGNYEFVVEAGQGQVGINNSNPAAALDVSGVVSSTGLTTSAATSLTGSFMVSPPQSITSSPPYFKSSTIIMKSPDGTCSGCGPSNADAWSCVSVTCPP